MESANLCFELAKVDFFNIVKEIEVFTGFKS